MTSTRRGLGSGGRGRGQAPCGRSHRKLKLASTDVIQSSSHAKKLASLLIRLFQEWCVFHVDGMWTSTWGNGSVSRRRMWTRGRRSNPLFLVDVKNGWLLTYKHYTSRWHKMLN